MNSEEVVDLLIDYAMLFIGRPYVWGGENAVWGYDCSGFVQECLRSIGLDPAGDQSAQAIYQHFLVNGERRSGRGALLFFGGGTMSIDHIALQINSHQMLEAGGGDSSTTSPEMASLRSGAMVRIRPILGRGKFVDMLMPHYGGIFQ